MTGSTSNLLQIQGKWYQERNPKKYPKPYQENPKSMLHSFWTYGEHRLLIPALLCWVECRGRTDTNMTPGITTVARTLDTNWFQHGNGLFLVHMYANVLWSLHVTTVFGWTLSLSSLEWAWRPVWKNDAGESWKGRKRQKPSAALEN